MTATEIRGRGACGRMIKDVLEEYPGGATIDVIQGDLVKAGRIEGRNWERDRVTNEANRLAREGVLGRRGRRRRFVFFLRGEQG